MTKQPSSLQAAVHHPMAINYYHQNDAHKSMSIEKAIEVREPNYFDTAKAHDGSSSVNMRPVRSVTRLIRHYQDHATHLERRIDRSTPLPPQIDTDSVDDGYEKPTDSEDEEDSDLFVKGNASSEESAEAAPTARPRLYGDKSFEAPATCRSANFTEGRRVRTIAAGTGFSTNKKVANKLITFGDEGGLDPDLSDSEAPPSPPRLLGLGRSDIRRSGPSTSTFYVAGYARQLAPPSRTTGADKLDEVLNAGLRRQQSSSDKAGPSRHARSTPRQHPYYARWEPRTYTAVGRGQLRLTTSPRNRVSAAPRNSVGSRRYDMTPMGLMEDPFTGPRSQFSRNPNRQAPAAIRGRRGYNQSPMSTGAVAVPHSFQGRAMSLSKDYGHRPRKGGSVLDTEIINLSRVVPPRSAPTRRHMTSEFDVKYLCHGDSEFQHYRQHHQFASQFYEPPGDKSGDNGDDCEYLSAPLPSIPAQPSMFRDESIPWTNLANEYTQDQLTGREFIANVENQVQWQQRYQGELRRADKSMDRVFRNIGYPDEPLGPPMTIHASVETEPINRIERRQHIANLAAIEANNSGYHAATGGPNAVVKMTARNEADQLNPSRVHLDYKWRRPAVENQARRSLGAAEQRDRMGQGREEDQDEA